jgi:AcrR family transcriptional regulator
MNGHDRRRQRISARIKQTALELFLHCGAEQVSMDEIALRAGVSKVTIYKYFHNKEALYGEVIALYVEETLAATEKMLESDLSFIDKLKFTLLAKLNSPKIADNSILFAALDRDEPSGPNGQESLKQRIKRIMFNFYEQGKKEGYIEEGQSFEMLYLYSEIVEAGFKAKSIDLEPILANPAAFDDLLQLYYFGVFRKTERRSGA